MSASKFSRPSVSDSIAMYLARTPTRDALTPAEIARRMKMPVADVLHIIKRDKLGAGE